MPDAGTTVPTPPSGDAVERVLAQVRDKGLPGMFPPIVAPGPEHTLIHTRDPRGEGDTRLLADLLARPESEPVRRALRALDAWCATAAGDHEPLLAPGVLAVTNPALFGPLLRELLTACRLGPTQATPRVTDGRVAQWTAFLNRFLERLRRDAAALAERDAMFRGPVTDLWAHGDETHNGGRRVLCLTFAGGGRVAYKDRPAGGEALFLAERRPGGPADTSVFALLNSLPPAAGPIRLPVLAVWSRRDASGAGYSWQEWVEPPEQGVLRETDGHHLTGTVLTPERARRYWRRAGALAAVCFGLGIADLTGDNLLAGRRGRDEEALAYPVDCEVFLADVQRLHHTGLTGDGTIAGTHHVGFESEPRWCGLGDPPLVWRTQPDGTLELGPPDRAFARTHTRSVVADSTGATGYGPHLPAMLRGMFDAWTLLCRHRDDVLRLVGDRAPDTYLRVIPRPTGAYHDTLAARARGESADDGLAPEELAQLARGDVPYFFRTASGGPLLVVADPGPPPDAESTGRQASPEAREAEPEGLPEIGRVDVEHRRDLLTLAGLGAALRDAAEGVFDQLTELESADVELGARLRLDSPYDGHVSFDWPETGRRISYLWSAEKLWLRVEDLAEPAAAVPEAPAGAIRRRLLRLDALDAAARVPWAAGDFTDTAAGARLERLTGAGLAWLKSVVAEHGWPGRALVGAAAASAASRLVQHATGELDFRRHCLELVRAAAERGDVPRREVAYLTDTIRLAEGRPQVYGTKFERVGGRLRPRPLEEPDSVDQRRAALGMEALERYAERLRERFPDPPDLPEAAAEASP